MSKAIQSLRWASWAAVAALLAGSIYATSLLVLAYRVSNIVDFVPLFLLFGIAFNLFFKDKRVMYISVIALPIVSAIVLPQLMPVAMTCAVALVWGALSMLLGAIRDRI